jgi:hypothetical protein
MPALNQKDAIHYIATRQQFTASALSGSTYSLGGGRLGGKELATFEADVNGADYFVYSYGTPIAWHTLNFGWYIVEQKFSATTSKHQTYTKRAIADSLQGVN